MIYSEIVEHHMSEAHSFLRNIGVSIKRKAQRAEDGFVGLSKQHLQDVWIEIPLALSGNTVGIL